MAKFPFETVPLPAERSTEKPRRKGFTMMMDWGLPVNQQRDWLDLVAPYVDLAKFVVAVEALNFGFKLAAGNFLHGCFKFCDGANDAAREVKP